MVINVCAWAQSCPTMQPHGLEPTRLFCLWLSQVRILEWVAISFSRGSSQPKDLTCVSCIAGGVFTTEPPGKGISTCRQRKSVALIPVWGMSTLELKQKRTEAQERVDKEAGSGPDFQEALPSASRTAPPRSVPSRFRRSSLPGQTSVSQSPLPPASTVPSPAMPSDLSGTWNLLSSDNVEGYMRALGRREGPCGASSSATRPVRGGGRRAGMLVRLPASPHLHPCIPGVLLRVRRVPHFPTLVYPPSP